MKHALPATSLLLLLFLTLHLADDIVLGYEKGNLANLTAVPIVVLWLFATLFFPRRRATYVITLFGSLLGMFVPYVHMSGKGLGAAAKLSGGLFFVWILLALGVTGMLAFILSVLELSKSLLSMRNQTSPH
jgi:hypothetical protein